MMEADRLLAERLQSKEREELTDEEKAKLFMELMEKRRKHFAALRAQENRKPPQTSYLRHKIELISMVSEVRNRSRFGINREGGREGDRGKVREGEGEKEKERERERKRERGERETMIYTGSGWGFRPSNEKIRVQVVLDLEDRRREKIGKKEWQEVTDIHKKTKTKPKPDKTKHGIEKSVENRSRRHIHLNGPTRTQVNGPS
ncbi:hypothetical protein Tco_0003883 [Tanacetum coccineum]